MKTVWEQILARYGQDLTMEPGGQTVQAFFQPLAEKSEQVPDEMTGSGWLDGRLGLYLGTMSRETGDTLRWQERRFQVRSCRPYCLGEQTMVFWAVLEEAKEAAS